MAKQLNDPRMFLINFNHIFFLYSHFFWIVIIRNSLMFKEKPEWIHWDILSLTVWFFEFLEMRCHLHFEVNLTVVLSNDFECNVFSFRVIPQILSGRFVSCWNMLIVASSRVSTQQQPQVGRTSLHGLQIHLSQMHFQLTLGLLRNNSIKGEDNQYLGSILNWLMFHKAINL